LQIQRSENGGWEASHEFVVKFADFASVSSKFAKGELLSVIDTNLPQPFDSFLRIDTVQIVRAEGDLLTLQVKATGSGSGQFELDELGEAAEPTYLLKGNLVDAPFQKHRKWKNLPEGDKKLLGLLLADFYSYDPARGILFRVTEDNWFVDAPEKLENLASLEFAKLIQQGVTTYQQSTYTWTETTEGDDELTSDQIDDLGQIVEPRGNPPKPTGTRNWILTDVSQSQAGQLYRTTLEWTLSEEGGHNSFLYSDD
jgi:hypothetical protein